MTPSQRITELEAENARLRAALQKAKQSHYYCEDTWYSCPLAVDGCANEFVPKDKCNCGAEELNAEIDALCGGNA
jgi:hypothetical protein